MEKYQRESGQLSGEEKATSTTRGLPLQDPSWRDFRKHVDPEERSELPRKELGVSFRNLGVYGYRTPSDYHHTVNNYPLRLGSLFRLFRKRTSFKVDILSGLDGVVSKGEILLVLGRPGSGCSTLLKSLAGEMHGIYLDTQSHLNYQGISPASMNKQFRGEYTYTAEHDSHFPELTVGETLQFAASCRKPRQASSNEERPDTSYSESLTTSLTTALNLSDVSGSKLGNEMIRGVSGGERKRVTIAEALSSWAPFQCWDNSTRGLDSATALRFIQLLRLCADIRHATSVVSLYQASQELYDSCDKVLLLYQGRQIYFGRIRDAVAYFERLGFFCPDYLTTADFLTALTHLPEMKTLVKAGFESRVPRCAEDFARLWNNSAERKSLLVEIETFNQEFPVSNENVRSFATARASEKSERTRSASPYTISLQNQIQLCLMRAFQRLRNNFSVPLGAAIGNIVMALVVGSVFFNMDNDTDSFFSRGILIFFGINLNATMGAFEVLTIWAQRPIVEKHQRHAFYHPFADAAAAMISDLPNKVITSLLFNLVLYFMTGLKRTPGAFFTWFVFSFTTFVAMSIFFRMVGSSSRTITATMAPVAITVLNFIIYTGFVIPAPYMRPWLGWFRYINPIGYAFESLLINEFQGRRFPCSQFIPVGPFYSDVGPQDRQCVSSSAGPGEAFVDGEIYLSTNFGYHRQHLWRNLGIIIAMGVGFCFVHLLTSEYILAERSRGEILLFLRGQNPKSSKTSDEEAAELAPQILDRDGESSSQRHESSDQPLHHVQHLNLPFHWRRLCYDIPTNKTKKRILDDIEGWVKPGTLTALMGATGAGKTTLLDVLAYRATLGTVTGNIMVGSQPRDSNVQRKIGYVQQADLHSPMATVREALEFSAILRQPENVPIKDKLAYVDQVVQLLDMAAFEHAIIGVQGQGLNIEQRKRLSIGVEMAAKPELLLFLDEPTSGLDSQTAWAICTFLRKLAHHGQAILCTVHQPSAQLFGQFDQILLLGPHGRTHYFGEVQQMVSYFEDNGAAACEPRRNPADWVLDITGAEPDGMSQIDWSAVWKSSEQRKLVERHLEELEKAPSSALNSRSATRASSFAAPFATQLYYVTRRVFKDYWRTPAYMWSRFFLCVGSALFLGFSFWDSPNSIQGLQNMLFSIFLFFMVFSQVVQQLVPDFVSSRALYEIREGPSKTYDWKVFMLAFIIVEIPWQTFMSVLSFLSWYYTIGFQKEITESRERHERAGLMCAFVWVFYLFCSTFSTAVSAALEHAEMCVNIANLLFYLSLIFCGVLVPPSSLPRFWIFMYRVSPLTYLVSGMFSVGVSRKHLSCSVTEIVSVPIPKAYSNYTCGEYLGAYMNISGGYVVDMEGSREEMCKYCPVRDTDTVLGTLGIRYEDRWRNFGLMWVFVLVNIGAALFLYWLARVPKGRRGETQKMNEQQQLVEESNESKGRGE